VLRHVWELHNVRGPLITWLQKLSLDARPYVWMRAALAMGMLASWDLAYAFHELIDPWASSSDTRPESSRRRLVAAVALDEAARNADTQPVIREIVTEWCHDGDEERRWTAAAALGYNLGLRFIDKSLKDIRTVGCWDGGRLRSVASWAVAELFARGGIVPVASAVNGWLSSRSPETRTLGLLATLKIADLRVADLIERDPAPGHRDGRREGRAARPRDAVDDAIAVTGKNARRSDGKLPPHVMVYFAMAMALFPDDDYEEVAARLTETLAGWGCWDVSWTVPTSGGITQAHGCGLRARRRYGACRGARSCRTARCR
jgi:hypothetical protein